MANTATAKLRRLPSVDEVVRSAGALTAIERFGRPAVVAAVRAVVNSAASHSNTGWPVCIDISRVQAVTSGPCSRTM